MDKISFLYLMFFVNIIIMIYTLMKISKKDDFLIFRKTLLIYITLIIPILGLFLYYLEGKRYWR